MLLKAIPPEESKSTGGTTLKNMHVPHFPEMALFETQFFPPGSGEREPGKGKGKGKEEEGRIRVRYHHPPQDNHDNGTGTGSGTARAETLDIPLTPDTSNLEELPITMHKSPTTGYNMGNAYNTWFSQRFGYEVVLAYLGDENSRAVLGTFPPGKHAAHKAHHGNSDGGRMGVLLRTLSYMVIAPLVSTFWGGGKWSKALVGSLLCALWVYLVSTYFRKRAETAKDERIGFADAAPYMVVSETSVADVTGRMEGGEEMDVRKFRANVVVRGAERAFDEDFWAELVIGNTKDQDKTACSCKLLLTANCVRCRSLDVDYTTGTFGTGESGRVFKKLMADRRVDQGAKYSPVFGRYGFLGVEGAGERTVRVGEEVVVARRMDERSVFGEFSDTGSRD